MFFLRSTLRFFILVLLLPHLFISCTEVKKSYWENGKLKSVLQYKEEKLNGECIWYFENGTISQQVEYKDNKLHGKTVRYFEDGDVYMTGNYVDNLKDSVFNYFSQNGIIIVSETYRNDSLHGIMRKYHESGKVMVEGRYNKGLMDGTWLFYSNTGEIIGKADFINGTGIQKSWYPNGKLQRVIRYNNNMKHGLEELFTYDGLPESSILYDKGKPITE